MKLRNALFSFTTVCVLKDASNPAPTPVHLPQTPWKESIFLPDFLPLYLVTLLTCIHLSAFSKWTASPKPAIAGAATLAKLARRG